jgi:hypothetical protein
MADITLRWPRFKGTVRKKELVPPEDDVKPASFVSLRQQRCVCLVKEVGLIGAWI